MLGLTVTRKNLFTICVSFSDRRRAKLRPVLCVPAAETNRGHIVECKCSTYFNLLSATSLSGKRTHKTLCYTTCMPGDERSAGFVREHRSHFCRKCSCVRPRLCASTNGIKLALGARAHAYFCRRRKTNVRRNENRASN